MTVLERREQEGIKRGIEQGMERGIELGNRSRAKKLLKNSLNLVIQ